MEALPPTRSTIVDVATMAGVGVATVSRVLNGHSNVRPATRARVLDAIEALDFRPNSLARSLSLGKTMVVAVVLPWFTSPSAVERVRGIVAGVADDSGGGGLATRHLIELGHRRIAFIGDTPPEFRFVWSRDRTLGYFHALEQAGVEMHPEYVRVGTRLLHVARSVALELLNLP